MEAGTMVGDNDGLFVRGTAAETKQKLDASCLRMKSFKSMVTTAMLANSLDTMLDTVHRRERVKHGLPATCYLLYLLPATDWHIKNPLSA